MSAVIATEELAVTPSPDRRRRRRPWPTLLVVGLVLAPVVATVVSIIGRRWYPGGDQALEVLRIHDVGTRHTPLLGAWSRWGWSHPGPALYWALAPFDRLFGDTGVLVGMGILNGAAIAGALLVAHRRGRTELAALAGLMMSLLLRALGLGLLVDPWNPWAAFFPFVLFLLLTWSVLCRDWPMLPLAALVGSFVVQTHAGYLPFVGPLLAIAVAYGVVTALRDRPLTHEAGTRAARWLTATAVLLFVMWLPALLQQAFGARGNLSELATYIRHPGEATAGWNISFGTLGNELRPVGPWVTGNDDGGFGYTAGSAVWPALVTLGLMAGAAAVAWRKRQRDAARLPVLAMLAAGLAVLATSKLTGGVAVYLTRWWWAVAAVASLGVVWALVKAFDNRRLRRVVTGVALVGIVVAGVMSVTDLPAPVPQARGSGTIRSLSNATANALDPGRRYLVRSADFTQFSLVSNGVFLALESRGFHVFVEPSDMQKLQFGDWRLASADQVDSVISVFDVAEFPGPPDPRSRLLASEDPLSPAERARAHELEATIRAQMGSQAPPGPIHVDSVGLRVGAILRGAPSDAVRELGDLQLKGDGYAVYLSPSR